MIVKNNQSEIAANEGISDLNRKQKITMSLYPKYIFSASRFAH